MTGGIYITVISKSAVESLLIDGRLASAAFTFIDRQLYDALIPTEGFNAMLTDSTMHRKWCTSAI